MRPVRLLLLPIVLPAALWTCSAEPSGVSVRLEVRGALFAVPPNLPPGPKGTGPCHESRRPGGQDAGKPGPHALKLVLPPGQT